MTSIPVLLYHHVAPDREITPQGFERQLRWLREQGFRSLSTREFYDHLTQKQAAPDRSVVITFDDGYADNWVYASPLLKKYAMKAHLFVITGYISSSHCRPTSEQGGQLTDTHTQERAPAGFLSWEELKAMSNSGIWEIGSHTHTHKHFLQHAPYDNLEKELQQSKEELENHLGRWSGTLAWPWGEFDEEWLTLLPKTGYRLAFTTRIGSNGPGRDPLMIRRFKVQRESVAWLAPRLWLYRTSPLANAYGHFYGLDRKIKN
ncbi:MAG: polysaccharide deacetylase family protein, partial [Elusimicrobia bacterium]|nr:polysaccharide deacetylase family protein [Elusimicrobiota bacterium]